jgi:hypothetical protein
LARPTVDEKGSGNRNETSNLSEPGEGGDSTNNVLAALEASFCSPFASGAPPAPPRRVNKRVASSGPDTNVALAAKHLILQMEMETLSYQKESLEMQLEEEHQRNEELVQRVKSENMEAAFIPASSDTGAEIESLRSLLEQEKQHWSKQLEDKDKKIEGLDATIKKLQEAAQYEGANIPAGEGVSQGRLQGMMLRMTATINGKDETIQTQKKQIDDLTEKLEEAESDDAILKVKLWEIKGQKEHLEFELEKERNIVLFEAELSKFKKQSWRPGHWHTGNAFN